MHVESVRIFKFARGERGFTVNVLVVFECMSGQLLK